jgi:hypothetical protein
VIHEHDRRNAARDHNDAKENENDDHHHDATLLNAIFFMPKVSSRPLTREMAVLPYIGPLLPALCLVREGGPDAPRQGRHVASQRVVTGACGPTKGLRGTFPNESKKDALFRTSFF